MPDGECLAAGNFLGGFIRNQGILPVSLEGLAGGVPVVPDLIPDWQCDRCVPGGLVRDFEV